MPPDPKHGIQWLGIHFFGLMLGHVLNGKEGACIIKTKPFGLKSDILYILNADSEVLEILTGSGIKTGQRLDQISEVAIRKVLLTDINVVLSLGLTGLRVDVLANQSRIINRGLPRRVVAHGPTWKVGVADEFHFLR